MDNNSIGLNSESPEATEAVGSLLGSVLIPGDIVLLDGDLGAGKTVLTRGIASGLGLAPHVTSPTYTLVFEHLAEDRAATDLFHFDVYRISGPRNFYFPDSMSILSEAAFASLNGVKRFLAPCPFRRSA